MKIRFTLLLLTVSILTFGQAFVYHPFPDSNATWCCEGGAYDSGNVYGWNCGIGGSCVQLTSTFSMDNKDTLINGILYHTVSYHTAGTQGCSPGCTGGFPISNDDGYYYIRQDIPSKRVYIRKANYLADSVLYDFNLNVGDTITDDKIFWPSISTAIVTSIDSIFIGSQYRAQYNFDVQGGLPSSLIEGVGSLSGGFIYPPSFFEGYNNLTGFIQDGIVLYGSYCPAIPLVVKDVEVTSAIKLSPNPFHTTTTLELKEDFGNAKLNIFNMFGELVHQQIIISAKTILHRNSLAEGIYFYQVQNSAGKLMIGRLMIE